MLIDCELMQLYDLNHSTHEPWHTIFIVLYTVLIITAFIFNSLVLFAVYRRSKKPENERSNFKTRNILIGLLCTFDILLTFTMPWTAADALTKFWPFGLETEILCKSTKSASAAVVYCSSMMIIIIAVDSYRQIVHPTNSQLSPVAILRLTPIILSLSFLMAFPIFYHARLISPDELSDGDKKPIHYLNDTSERSNLPSVSNANSLNILDDKRWTISHSSFNISDVNTFGDSQRDLSIERSNQICGEVENDGNESWDHVIYCAEDWEFGGEVHNPVNRIYYSIFQLTVQYCIPFITISVLYFLVYLKLRNVSVVRSHMQTQTAQDARHRDNKREKKTNRMLITISMVFCFCWFPLNLIGTVMDAYPYFFGMSTDSMRIIFMSCHILGMCSACINPIIYGFRNETIKTGTIQTM